MNHTLLLASVSSTPVQVKGENVLWQQLGSHDPVKKWSEV